MKLFYGTGQRLDQRNIKGTDSSVVEGHALPPAHVLHSLADGRRREDVLFKEKQRQRILPFTFGKVCVCVCVCACAMTQAPWFTTLALALFPFFF